MIGTVVSTLACLVLLRATSAQSPFVGTCPKLRYQDHFNLARYFTGLWYEQRRFFAYFEVGLKCNRAEYKVLPTGFVQVNNSGFVTSKGVRTFSIGTAYCDSEQAAKCFVRFSENQPWGSYNVLATDYRTYSVVYSCSQGLGRQASQYGWILTRQRQPDRSVVQRGLAVLVRHGIDISGLLTTAQDCC